MNQIVPPDELSANHLRDASLYANRLELARSFAKYAPKAIGEIGVAYGDFSVAMIEMFKPESFLALDTFDIHLHSDVWGRPPSERFGTKTHRQFFEDRVRPLVGHLDVKEGLSAQTAAQCADGSLDLLYVDGDHHFEGAWSDAQQAARIVRSNGTIIFNDYTMYDPLTKDHYGVVQAVNKLVSTSEWRVVGFALNPLMFCDIALRRR
jgi:hypothetical protein